MERKKQNEQYMAEGSSLYYRAGGVEASLEQSQYHLTAAISMNLTRNTENLLNTDEEKCIFINDLKFRRWRGAAFPKKQPKFMTKVGGVSQKGD